MALTEWIEYPQQRYPKLEERRNNESLPIAIPLISQTEQYKDIYYSPFSSKNPAVPSKQTKRDL